MPFKKWRVAAFAAIALIGLVLTGCTSGFGPHIDTVVIKPSLSTSHSGLVGEGEALRCAPGLAPVKVTANTQLTWHSALLKGSSRDTMILLIPIQRTFTITVYGDVPATVAIVAFAPVFEMKNRTITYVPRPPVAVAWPHKSAGIKAIFQTDDYKAMLETVTLCVAPSK
jgi:hypothetical protein